jgi:ketopantoate hydroxymethyltransferase
VARGHLRRRISVRSLTYPTDWRSWSKGLFFVSIITLFRHRIKLKGEHKTIKTIEELVNENIPVAGNHELNDWSSQGGWDYIRYEATKEGADNLVCSST